MSNKRTQPPALPEPNTGNGALNQLLRVVKEQVERWRGDRGDPLDRAVTFRDLKEGRVAQWTGRPNEPGGGLAPIESGIEHSVGALSNLSAKGAFETVVLSWDGTSQQYYGYTEVWRNSADNLANAVLRGTSTAPLYADQVDPGSSYYYWVRPVSDTGKAGPFNATAGTLGETSRDPDQVRDIITSKSWQADTAYSPFEVVAPRDSNGDPYKNADGVALAYQAISGGTTGSSEPTWPTTIGNTVTDGSVTWEAVVAGEAPFIVGTINGQPVVFMPGAVMEEASIESAKIKSLAADKIDAAQLSAITADLGSITAGSLNIGSGKFVVDQNGNVTIQSAASGARLVIRNNVIKVFDSTGTKRVQLGDLTA